MQGEYEVNIKKIKKRESQIKVKVNPHKSDKRGKSVKEGEELQRRCRTLSKGVGDRKSLRGKKVLEGSFLDLAFCRLTFLGAAIVRTPSEDKLEVTPIAS